LLRFHKNPTPWWESNPGLLSWGGCDVHCTSSWFLRWCFCRTLGAVF
jgi:hypothetical protein